MQQRAHRVWKIGVAPLVASLVLVAAMAQRAIAECDVGICQGNPCTITGRHEIDSGCTLAFGATTDVTLAPNGALLYGSEGGGRITARDFTVQGAIRGKAMGLDINLTGNFRTEGRGRITSSQHRFIGGVVSISADGDVTLAGSSIKVRGDWAYFTAEAGGNVQVDARINTRGCQDDYADIQLLAGGSITTTKALSSKSCGTTAGSSMTMIAGGDITVGGSLTLSSGFTAEFPVDVYIESGGSVTLGKVQLLGQLAHKGVEVHAAANITLGGNMTAKSFLPGDGFNRLVLDPGPTGVVRIAKRINFSCGSTCGGVSGSITVGTGCYTDVTDADLAARPTGPISLGCSCIHPTGSNVCDGGCVGLDTATFDPPINTNLPPCS